MMIIFNKAFAKVFKKWDRLNYSISTGDKQQNGEWRNSNWNMRLIGSAKEKVINAGDRIEIKGGKIENVWDKERKKSWLNLYVWDLEIQDTNTDDGIKDNPFADDGGGFYPVNTDDDLPF